MSLKHAMVSQLAAFPGCRTGPGRNLGSVKAQRSGRQGLTAQPRRKSALEGRLANQMFEDPNSARSKEVRGQKESAVPVMEQHAYTIANGLEEVDTLQINRWC